MSENLTIARRRSFILSLLILCPLIFLFFFRFDDGALLWLFLFWCFFEFRIVFSTSSFSLLLKQSSTLLFFYSLQPKALNTLSLFSRNLFFPCKIVIVLDLCHFTHIIRTFWDTSTGFSTLVLWLYTLGEKFLSSFFSCNFWSLLIFFILRLLSIEITLLIFILLLHLSWYFSSRGLFFLFI